MSHYSVHLKWHHSFILFCFPSQDGFFVTLHCLNIMKVKVFLAQFLACEHFLKINLSFMACVYSLQWISGYVSRPQQYEYKQ